MVENWPILCIPFQKKVLVWFWFTQSNLHFSDLKFPKRGAENQDRTFFLKKDIQNLSIFHHRVLSHINGEKNLNQNFVFWLMFASTKNVDIAEISKSIKIKISKMMKMIEKMMKQNENFNFPFFFIMISDACLGAVRSVLWISKLILWWRFFVILRPFFQFFGEIPVQIILDFPDFPEIHPSLRPRISELKRS